MIELTEGGKHPIALPDGETRQFLEDGDELVLVGHARRDELRSIGFALHGRVGATP